MTNFGRPPKFETPEELDNMVEAYFMGLEYENNEGKICYKPATLTGLALFLGFCDKQSLYDYQKKPDFSYSIKKARTMIEEGYERALLSRNSTGAIFALKNFNWSDKVQIEDATETDYTVEFPEFEEGELEN